MKYVLSLLVALTLNSFCVAEHILAAPDVVVPFVLPGRTPNLTPAVSEPLHTVVHGEIPTAFLFELLTFEDTQDIRIIVSGDAWVVAINDVTVAAANDVFAPHVVGVPILPVPIFPEPVLQFNRSGTSNVPPDLFVFDIKSVGQAIPAPSTLGMFVISAVPLSVVLRKGNRK